MPGKDISHVYKRTINTALTQDHLYMSAKNQNQLNDTRVTVTGGRDFEDSCL